MTKEVLEQAKALDDEITSINKVLTVLRSPMLKIYSGFTGTEISFNVLNHNTASLVKSTMIDALVTRREELQEQLERM